MKQHLFAAAVVAATAFSCGHQLTPEEERAIDEKARQEVEKMLAEKEGEAEAEETTDLYKWSYEDEVDEMTSETRHIATIASPDIVNMEFPYEGGSILYMTVRNMAGDADAFIYISKGQLFTEYGAEYINVRFDDEKPSKFSVSDASDNNAQYLFINDAKKFTNKLKTAKKVAIECQFYNNGKHVFKFDTAGFTWAY